MAISTITQPTSKSVGAESAELKIKLAAAFRIIAQHGLDDGIAGHISVRVPGASDQFWVNPLGPWFEEITADDLLRIDHEGNILEGRHEIYNRAGFCIHSEIHKARPEVVAICHTHPPSGTAFSALGLPLRIVDQTSCSFWDEQAVFTKYTGVVDDLDLAKELAAALGDKRVAILQNHGLVTCSKSIEQAVVDMLDLERTCDLNLRLLNAPGVQEVPPAVALETRRVFKSRSRVRLQWDALVRRIETLEPHYAGSLRGAVRPESAVSRS
jgi:ribulose-5-phosphate 4-epimerase/fuculose-1-phosphate aldolase